jgi:hypothetical protein
MPDAKITALTSIGTSTDPANDPLVLVDVSDTSMAASGTTKKVTLNQLLATSPTATLASATITGDLTVDTSTLKVDSANNRVGVLTAAPARTLDVNGVIRGNSDFEIATSGGVTQGYIFGSGTSLFYRTVSGSDHVWQNVGTEWMRLNSTGLGVGVTPSASGGCLQLKSGITFPATQVASSDANTLDDYEEGTWTGTLKGSVSDPTTPVTATGIYTKVGKLVTITIAYSNVNTTGASGNVTITGLPFAGAATGAGSVITFDMFTTSTTLACWNVGTTIAFYVSGGFIPATHNAGASRNVNVTMTYFV